MKSQAVALLGRQTIPMVYPALALQLVLGSDDFGGGVSIAHGVTLANVGFLNESYFN